MITTVDTRAAEPGLTTDQAATLLAEFGPNLLVPEARRDSALQLIWTSVKDPMVLLLVVAAAVYFATGDITDAVVAVIALIPIATVGLVLERRSESALERLRALTAPNAEVLRDGCYKQLPTAQIVPGDVISIKEGDVVPADAGLIDGRNVVTDESALTGESMPVEKGTDRSLLAGTTIVAGRGTALVTATGAKTEYGMVGRLVAEVKQPPTPLERMVRRFTSRLLVVALVFVLFVALVELIRGRGLAAALIAGVSLAIAAVPEEFPMVYTLYLALGAWRLARRKALVRRLSGVEGLGAASVICTDKTGTLTTGRPAVALLRPVSETPETRDSERVLLEAALLATDPNPFDPLDVAVAQRAREEGIEIGERALVHAYGFDPRNRYMSHVWSSDRGFEVAAKGALEGILKRSHATQEIVERAEAINAQLANEGMRILAVAHGRIARLSPQHTRHDDESQLRFAGLIGFADPLRPGVKEAIAECRQAGVRVIMVTGDHPLTARSLAASLDLPSDDVFARVRPEQKHALVRELKRQGQIVAMTGDGINDAPALREADIGVAMGKRGTEVAREAATLVLLDDNFATIVSAVREGRRIFSNLRKAFAYLIAFHLPLLVAAFLVPVLGAPLLLLPVHLVLLELFVHPVVSLVFEDAPAPPSLMKEPPRPAAQFLLGKTDMIRSAVQGTVLSAGVIALYLWRLSLGEPVVEARTTAFLALVAGQIFLLAVERTRPKPIWPGIRDFGRTSTLVLVAAAVAVAAALYIPSVAALLRLEPLSITQCATAVTVGALCTLWAEILKMGRPTRVDRPVSRQAA